MHHDDVRTNECDLNGDERDARFPGCILHSAGHGVKDVKRDVDGRERHVHNANGHVSDGATVSEQSEPTV